MGNNKFSNSKLDAAKQVIKKYYDQADCGIFNTHNIFGHKMMRIFSWINNENSNYLTIDICLSERYFEVFGLTEDEFLELEDYYCGL